MTEDPPAAISGVYCTVVARNYLPQALSLYTSIQKHEPHRPFVILVIDGVPAGLEDMYPGVRFAELNFLGLTSRELLDLATIYDVVELSTAVKPLFLQRLRDEFDQAVYLDPDTYLISPLVEIESLVEEHGVVLTPHLLEPITPGESFRSEVNSLTVGVHNLGFCAVGRGSDKFLDWWWSHLERECLIYPLLGLFVDQKWVDVGSVLFDAHSFRHYGYNIAHWNLHEREFERRGSNYYMIRTDEPLRLLHFSGFDPKDPEAISVRQNISLREKGLNSAAYSTLSREYAALLLDIRQKINATSSYAYSHDLSGRLLTKRLRRTYRQELLKGGLSYLPSPFIESDRAKFARWRLTSLMQQMTGAAGDAAIGLKYAFPDAYGILKRVVPSLYGQVREQLLRQGQIRR
ncbi:hypothetical protein [Sinomonas albida]|uniref:hypothetical protein n=1 Tax=Sinomonas albida TaxID=369942 RepID=UPI0010A847BE|nr:hypothetical protein [Sinomonas albida]